jgi:hypothetical protein
VSKREEFIKDLHDCADDEAAYEYMRGWGAGYLLVVLFTQFPTPVQRKILEEIRKLAPEAFETPPVVNPS